LIKEKVFCRVRQSQKKFYPAVNKINSFSFFEMEKSYKIHKLLLLQAAA